MADPVTPALTAEEWADASTAAYWKGHGGEQDGERKYEFVVGVGDSRFRPATRHQCAAIALHGQPYGFTREDARLLSRLGAGILDSVDVSAEEATRLLTLANRIAALLPPEGTP